MHTLLKRRVVVLGGYGEFSRRVASGIAALAPAECVLGLPPASRATTFASRVGVPFMVLDPNDPGSLHRLLEGAFALVNVRGPFAAREDLAIAELCAQHGVHYVDPGDTRAYLTEFTRLARTAREHDVLLVTGAGAAPAVTSALAAMLATEFDRVSEIQVLLSPGIGDERELATTRAVLERAGAPLAKVSARGREAREMAWSQKFDLPDPVGRRRGYLCDLPDLDLFQRHFGARTVIARAGLAPGVLSKLLALFAALRRGGWMAQLSPFAAGLVRLGARLTRAEADAAAIRVAVRGSRHGVEQEHVACLIGRASAGPAMAAAPIVTLVRTWLEQGVRDTGALACIGLLDLSDLKPELARHDIVLVRQ
jgi:saccharopine dehydrogenase-like NADP-dependent oxidoreductase